jgi:hypothetical protein
VKPQQHLSDIYSIEANSAGVSVGEAGLKKLLIRQVLRLCPAFN